MALITKAQLQEHYETDLGDDALDRLIDAADREIVKRFGPHATQTDTMRELRLSTAIFLSRRASSITSVTEEIRSEDGLISETVLAEDDYKLRRGNLLLERLADGTNGRGTWGDVVTVIYVPADDNDLRIRVEIELCILSAEFDALDTERVGDYSSSRRKYEDEREGILAALRSGLTMA